MAAQDITTAMSALAVRDAPPPPPPRPNFPLLRELRDQIYGYILDNQYTRVKRPFYPDPDHATGEGRTAYHFHTNILAVNHAIHDEAEKLLYERNVFVVASYQRSELSDTMNRMLQFPAVAIKHVARMRHHSLRIHFKSPELRTQQSKKIDSALFLANHMELFCRLLRGELPSPPSNSVQIDTLPGDSKPSILESPILHANLKKPFRIMCELRNTRHRVLDRGFQACLLSSLASITSDSLVVTFCGDIVNLGNSRAQENDDAQSCLH